MCVNVLDPPPPLSSTLKHKATDVWWGHYPPPASPGPDLIQTRSYLLKCMKKVYTLVHNRCKTPDNNEQKIYFAIPLTLCISVTCLNMKAEVRDKGIKRHFKKIVYMYQSNNILLLY